METPADIAAMAPWVLGYEPGHNDVALFTLDRDGSSSAVTGPTVMFPCDDIGSGLDGAVRDTARRIVNEFPGKPLAFAIGYGDNGDLLATQVAQTFQDALAIDADTIPLHHDGSHVQMITPDGGKVDCGPLPDVSAEMTALGRPTPSASRTMKDREWHPDPVPSYEALPSSIAERLETFPPTERAEEAVRLARVLSDGDSRNVPSDQRRLAGLINSSTDHWVSDRLMMEACTAPTPAMADTLRQLYVQAPPEYQQSIAGLAAITHYAQYGNSQALRAVSTQLDPEGPGFADAKIVDMLSRTLPEFRKFQQQIARAAERATETDLGGVKDVEWRRGTQQLHPAAEAERATSEAPDTSSQRDGQRPQTPPQMPGHEQGPPSPRPDGPSMS
ncbi:hypothetical protein ACNHUS_15110 [Actinomycetes bacterium M1A6_2h]